MRILLAEHHSFNERAVKKMQHFLNREMSAEEILHALVSQFEPIIALAIENDVVRIDHPGSY